LMTSTRKILLSTSPPANSRWPTNMENEI
jgi:hypothetical protein